MFTSIVYNVYVNSDATDYVISSEMLASQSLELE